MADQTPDETGGIVTADPKATEQIPRIIVCGSRRYTDAIRIRSRLDMLPRPFVLVHGAIRGADTIADTWGREHDDVTIEPHPANWKAYGHAAGPLRNQEMAVLGAALCLAWPLPESSGTWDMVNRADAAGIPTEVDYG